MEPAPASGKEDEAAELCGGGRAMVGAKEGVEQVAIQNAAGKG